MDDSPIETDVNWRSVPALRGAVREEIAREESLNVLLRSEGLREGLHFGSNLSKDGL
jgi:hypothetical protein